MTSYKQIKLDPRGIFMISVDEKMKKLLYTLIVLFLFFSSSQEYDFVKNCNSVYVHYYITLGNFFHFFENVSRISVFLIRILFIVMREMFSSFTLDIVIYYFFHEGTYGFTLLRRQIVKQRMENSSISV